MRLFLFGHGRGGGRGLGDAHLRGVQVDPVGGRVVVPVRTGHDVQELAERRAGLDDVELGASESRESLL